MKVYKCSLCDLRTTDPLILRGEPVCPICAEDIAPRALDRRERRYQRELRGMEDVPRYQRQFFDQGKHR